MMEPSGPLPPEIYRRRRWLAIGAAVVALVLLIWIVSAVRGGGDDEATDAAAASASLTTTTTASPSTSASESGSASSSGSSGSSSVTDSASGTADAPATPVAAGQCPDSSLAVKVSASKPTYPAGEEPEFGIVVTNIGNAPCDRELGAGMQQVLVYTLDTQQRLWSNNDCFPNAAADVRTLAAGEQAAFTVKWSGATSEPGCTAPREPVPAGAYSVVGQLGNLRSAPEPFNLS
ncbi:hypothetical protein [Rhodococcus sp. RD6.2]|uniref:hypothetical protein n=1 Tax=Rhodococcus sp. RD6.2 TaxID=260936 RepID=UPI000679B082|nr:hypothetical protein [Rhodococcus sp. RD6.2]